MTDLNDYVTPAAWRVRDYSDGWIYSEKSTEGYSLETGCLSEALYSTDTVTELKARAEAAEAKATVHSADAKTAWAECDLLRKRLEEDALRLPRLSLESESELWAKLEATQAARRLLSDQAHDNAVLIADLQDRLKRALEIIRPFGEIGQMVLAEAPAEATEFTAFIDCEGDWHKIPLEHFRVTTAFLKETDDANS